MGPDGRDQVCLFKVLPSCYDLVDMSLYFLNKVSTGEHGEGFKMETLIGASIHGKW